MCVHRQVYTQRCTCADMQTWVHTLMHTYMLMYAHMGMCSIPVCAALLVWGHLENLPKTPYQLDQVSVEQGTGSGTGPQSASHS